MQNEMFLRKQLKQLVMGLPVPTLAARRQWQSAEAQDFWPLKAIPWTKAALIELLLSWHMVAGSLNTNLCFQLTYFGCVKLKIFRRCFFLQRNLYCVSGHALASSCCMSVWRDFHKESQMNSSLLWNVTSCGLFSENKIYFGLDFLQKKTP